MREAQKKELQRMQELGLQQQQYAESMAENSIVVGQQLSVDSYDGTSAGMGLDDSQQRDNHPIAFPIFTQA